MTPLNLFFVVLSLVILAIRIFFSSGGSGSQGKLLTIGNTPDDPMPAPDETVLPAIFRRVESTLPDGLYLQRTCFAWREVTITGSLRARMLDADVAVFDLAYRHEDHRNVKQTIAAFPRASLLGGQRTPPTLENGDIFEIAGEWLLYFNPGQVIPSSKLESWVSEGLNRARQAGTGFSNATVPVLAPDAD